MNSVLIEFDQINAARLQFEVAYRKDWLDRVARGVVTPEHAAEYIRMADNIISNRRRLLGLPNDDE